jgi:CRP/FNR family transcriptional regulator, cyclic AMP receptor protein
MKSMIAQDHLKRIAIWSRELSEREIEVARAGISERSYGASQTIFVRGDQFDDWTGVVSGLARMSIVSRGRQDHDLYRHGRRRLVWRRHDAEE